MRACVRPNLGAYASNYSGVRLGGAKVKTQTRASARHRLLPVDIGKFRL
jgi:hypothetical protein